MQYPVFILKYYPLLQIVETHFCYDYIQAKLISQVVH